MEPDEEDRAVQVALLHHVLDEHPALLSRADLVRELSSDSGDWTQRDAVERAVSELVKQGLLRYLDDYVLPTRAALHGRLLGGL
ncbi:MAG: hypothetical protein ACTHNP_07160 [Solirubrobacterales bacterium]